MPERIRRVCLSNLFREEILLFPSAPGILHFNVELCCVDNGSHTFAKNIPARVTMNG